MSSSILIRDYASLMECRLNDYEMTSSLQKAGIVVNPSYGSLYDKIIIINLPVEVPIDILMQYNIIVSRFKIGYGIPVIEYELPENRKTINKEDYSLIILNKELLQDNDYAPMVNNTNFLIGVDTDIDGDITLVGYLLLRTTLEQFESSDL